MKSDDEKLRELFEVKEKSAFSNAIRRAKFLSIIRTTIVSFIMFVIIGFILLLSNVTALTILSDKKNMELDDWYDIAMPNSYIGNWQVDNRIMVGEIDYVRYRFLGDRPIEDGNYKEVYTYMPLLKSRYDMYDSFSSYLVKTKAHASETFIGYDKVGKHVMEFYHPLEKFESYTNDIEKLSEIDNKKFAEISLSFDKGYSIEEVQNMMPKDVTLNWCWVDTFDEKELDYRVLDEYQVYGFKLIDRWGEIITDPSKKFIDTIVRCKDNKNNNYIYQKIYNNLCSGEGKISKENLKIIGVVVTGNVESLKSLRDKGYIKAATLGTVADKY